MNDLYLYMKYSDVNMYADDTSLAYVSEYIKVTNDSVNEDMYNISSLLQANRMFISVFKTQCLVISNRKRLKDISDGRVAQPAFVVSDENISIVENSKYLGVMADR